MATDFYLKIEGVEGEAEVKGFEKQMQLQSWSFGASNAGRSDLGTGAGTGKVSMQDFHFVVQNGKASTKLFIACCEGTHIKKATLTCRKAGKGPTPQPYLEYVFSDVVVSSFQTGGSDGNNSLPTDQIAFNFTQVTKTYLQQKADGNTTRADTVSYNTKTLEGTGGIA